MNLNGAGGLMLLVVAALWLWVFVPSWVKQSERKQEIRRNNNSLKSEIKNNRSKPLRNFSGVAAKTYRLVLVRRFFAATIFVSLATTGCSSYLATENFFWLFAAAPSLILLVSSCWVVFKASRRIDQLSLLALESRSQIFSKYAATLEADQSSTDSRAWVRTELPEPKQSLARVEQVEIASVEVLETSRVRQVDLDEIIRRRRANG